MIQILVKEMCNYSLKGWKSNAIYEFQDSKCKNFNYIEFKKTPAQKFGIYIH